MRTAEQHAQAILARYRGDSSQQAVAKRFDEARTAPQRQIPDAIAALPTHELQRFDVAVGYIDLRRFTWRTFVDDALDTARLAQSFIVQCAQIIADRGGYVIGARGDGIMFAVGSNGHAPYPKTMCTLGIVAFALDMTQNALNEQLEAQGLRRVQARGGVDYGDVVFGWYLNGDQRELNPNAFPANFASKCEKEANAWQVVIGDQARDAVGDSAIAGFEPHGEPATYTLDGVTHSYRMHRWKWEDNTRVRAWAAQLPKLVAGRRPDDLDPVDVLGTPELLGSDAAKTLDRNGRLHINVGSDQHNTRGNTSVRGHRFHSPATTPPPAVRRDAWWRAHPQMLRAEKAAMRDALPEFAYEKLDGRPSWVGSLSTSARTYQVRVTFWHHRHDQLPVVEILDPPDLDADSATRPMPPEHFSAELPWGRNVPCVAAPDDWTPPETTVVDVLAWTADWLLAYEAWCSGYLWPGERIGRSNLV